VTILLFLIVMGPTIMFYHFIWPYKGIDTSAI